MGSQPFAVQTGKCCRRSVVAATATACLGEDAEGERDEQSEAKIDAPR